jgi:hypothetical protein
MILFRGRTPTRHRHTMMRFRGRTPTSHRHTMMRFRGRTPVEQLLPVIFIKEWKAKQFRTMTFTTE